MIMRQSKTGVWAICQIALPGVLVGLAAGCFQPEPITCGQLERDCIVLLPGIDSGAQQFDETVKGLQDAGIDRPTTIIEWGLQPFGKLMNQINLPANQESSRRIAACIEQHHEEYPDSRIILIGFSSGAALAVMTAETLEEKVVLDRLILMAASLSPGYDLSGALSHCRNGVVSFYSEWDWYVLGVLTSLVGTVDRKFTSAAGRVGLQDAAGNLVSYPGLTQISWTPDWLKLGHEGGHFDWLSDPWAREVLALYIDPSRPPREDQ